MKKRLQKSTSKAIERKGFPRWLWGGVFGVWIVLLSGVVSDFTGSPGFIQAFRLKQLLSQKQNELKQLEGELSVLDLEKRELEKNPELQEREIRRVLGYVGKDELIFDFGQ